MLSVNLLVPALELDVAVVLDVAEVDLVIVGDEDREPSGVDLDEVIPRPTPWA